MNGTARWPMTRAEEPTEADIADAARVRNLCDVLEPGVGDKIKVANSPFRRCVRVDVLAAIRAQPGISARELVTACQLHGEQGSHATHALAERGLIRVVYKRGGGGGKGGRVGGSQAWYWPVEVA